MYPAGDVIGTTTGTLISVDVTLAGTQTHNTCAFEQTRFQLVANHNAQGPVTNDFSPAPTLSACYGGSGVYATSQGVWKLSAQEFSTATPSITIPPGGLSLSLGAPHQCTISNFPTVVFPGTGWFNGFTSPVNVSTAVSFGSTGPQPFGTDPCNGQAASVTLGAPGLLTLTDLTNPAAVPLLGP
jgi:hypothetical protein